MKMSPNLPVTGSIQNKSLCSLEIRDRNEQNNYLKKGLNFLQFVRSIVVRLMFVLKV